MQSLTNDRAHLTSVVEKQEISAADVDRMNAERDQLAKSITLVSDQLDQTNKTVWNKEIAIQKKMDSLERSVEKFNTLLYQLDLLGGKQPRYACMSEELELYIQNSQPEKMVSIDLRKEAKPAINAMIESFKKSFHKISEDSITLQEKLDTIGWNLLKKEEEEKLLKSKIKSINDTYAIEKLEIGLNLKKQTDEIESLEKSCHQLKVETNMINQNTVTKETRSLQVYEDKIKRLYHERDLLLANVVKSMTTCFGFEQAVSEEMEALQRAVLDAEKF